MRSYSYSTFLGEKLRSLIKILERLGPFWLLQTNPCNGLYMELEFGKRLTRTEIV